jgi:hypothetical protein
VEQTGCVSELRKDRRIETRKPARLSVEDVWHDCLILDVSGGGARLLVDLAIAPGTTVVLAAEDLGLVAGVVQRSDNDGVSLAFGVGPEARGALLDRLAGFLNGNQ